MILPLMTSLEQLLFTPSCSIPNLWTGEKSWLWQFHTYSYFFGWGRLPFCSISVCYSSNFDLPNRQKTYVADALDGRHFIKNVFTIHLVCFAAFVFSFLMTPNSSLPLQPPRKKKIVRVTSQRRLPKNAFPGNLRMTCLVCNNKSWCKSIFFI